MRQTRKTGPLPLLMGALFAWAAGTLGGCSYTKPTAPIQRPTFSEVLETARAAAPPQQDQAADPLTVTLSVEAMPLGAFVRAVGRLTGVSIVIDQALDTAPITADVRNVSVDDLLGSVARRIGADLTKTGSLYGIGQLRPEDRGVLVFKSSRLTGETLADAAAVFLSDAGSAIAQPDGLLLASDRVEVLARVVEALQLVDAQRPKAWVAQYYLFALTRSTADSLGLTTAPAISLSALASTTEGASALVAAALQGAFEATATQAENLLVARPTLYLRDGAAGEIASVVRIPVPQRSVSPEGTVSTVGFEEVEAGMSVVATVRDLGTGHAELSSAVLLSSISGFVEERPILAEQRIVSDAVPVHSGGVYLLASTETTMTDRQRERGLSNRRSADDSDGYVALWVVVSEAGGPRGGPQGPGGAPRDGQTTQTPPTPEPSGD